MSLEMVCTCSVAGVREAEARRRKIFQRMDLDDASDFTEAIVLSLAFDFQADVDVCADQWFGVSLQTPLLEKGLYVECDWPGDGLAALWEHLAEAFPDRVSTKKNPSLPLRRIEERILSALFQQYETAEGQFREHRDSHGDKNAPFCEDCSVFMGLSITAHRTLDEAWGSRVMDPTVEKAFA